MCWGWHMEQREGELWMCDKEEILPYGNVNEVVRIGNTVHRTTEWSSFVHDLLRHLDKPLRFRGNGTKKWSVTMMPRHTISFFKTKCRLH